MNSKERSKKLNSKEEFLLKFIERAIDKINVCYANIYTLQTLLIKKEVATEQEIIDMFKDAKNMPQRKIGKETLSDIVEGLSIDRLDEIMDLSIKENDERLKTPEISKLKNNI